MAAPDRGMLADAPSAEYDQTARDALTASLRAELADLPAFTTEAGPPLVTSAGAVLDLWPDDEVLTVIERVRAAIRQTRGETALQHAGGRPHISFGYSYRTAPSDPLSSTLRNKITPRRAPLRVDRVHLLDVEWAVDDDLGGWRMTWEPVSVIPLGHHPRPRTGHAMSTGWLLLIALGVVVVGGFLAAVCRGLAQKARAETRQDLIRLSSARDTAAILSERGGLPAYAFMAPGAEKRSYPLGWLWWRVEHTADDTPQYTMGWALTYRRARRVAGLPLSIRAQHTEITLV